MPVDWKVRVLRWATVGDGCWTWHGLKDRHGYGQVTIEGKFWRAHRAAYRAFIGAIPAGECVCHRCDNRACINPAHLFLGTNQENTADRVRKGRSARLRGSSNPAAKFDERTVKSALLAVASGETQRSVAARYGISKQHMSQLVNGTRRCR